MKVTIAATGQVLYFDHYDVSRQMLQQAQDEGIRLDGSAPVYVYHSEDDEAFVFSNQPMTLQLLQEHISIEEMHLGRVVDEDEQ